MADSLGNEVAREGLDRCFCGCKYWEHDVCIDCGTHVTKVPRPRCDGAQDCLEQATMIDKHGWVYCTDHGMARRSYDQPCRKLRPHELRRLQRGEQVRSY